MAAAQHSGNPGNFAEDRKKAVRAGHVGGQHSSGNFARNRERAVEAGRKGGLASRRACNSGNEHDSDNRAADHGHASAQQNAGQSTL